MTAFIQLCQEGEVDQVRQAIALNPICIYETDADGCGSLHWAAFYNNVTLLSLLLNAALKTSTTTVTDWLNRHGGQQQATALHWAVRGGHVQAVSVLMKHGASLGAVDGQGFTVFHLSAQEGHSMLSLYLCSLLVSPPDQTRLLLNTQDKFKQTPMHWLAFKAPLQAALMMVVFVEMGARTDVLDQYGMTCVHWACAQGHRDVIDVLLKLVSSRSELDMRVGETPENTPVADSGVQKGLNPADLVAEKRGDEGRKWMSNLIKRPPMSHMQVLHSLSPNNPSVDYYLYALPFIMFPVPALLFKFLTWYFAIPLSLVIVFGTAQVVLSWRLDGDQSRFITSIVPNAVMQAGVFYFVFNWLVVILPSVSSDDMPSTWWPVCFMFIFITALSCVSLYKTVNTTPGYVKFPESLSMVLEEVKKLAAVGDLDDRHFCMSCLTLKPLRSKHCKYCGRCIGKFDHHCPWTYNCIGYNNHRWFMVFLYSMPMASLLGIISSLLYLQDLLRIHHKDHPTQSQFEEMHCYSGVDVCGYFYYDSTSMLAMISCIMPIFICGIMAITQTVYVMTDLTTNESINSFRYAYLNNGVEARDGNHYHNPFDLGAFRNLYSFWSPRNGSWRHVDWLSVVEVPTPKDVVEYNGLCLSMSALGRWFRRRRRSRSNLVYQQVRDNILPI